MDKDRVIGFGAGFVSERRRAYQRLARYETTLRQIADSGDGSINAHLARTVLGDGK